MLTATAALAWEAFPATEIPVRLEAGARTTLTIGPKTTVDVALAQSTLTIDGVIVLQPIGAIITNTDPAADITLTNTFTHTVNENKIVIAVWDESTVTYKVLQAACP